MDLKDHVAVVTGGARGIGWAICTQLADRGAQLAVLDIEQGPVDEAVEALKKKGAEAAGFCANVCKSDEVNETFKNIIDTYGRVDILVNNAGITRDNLFVRMKEEEWDSVIDVNLKGTYNCIKAVTRPMMKAKYGKIVSIASVVGVMGNAGQANYSASKAGIIGLTKSVAKELANRNVNVNAVAPGYIKTEMTEKLSEEAHEAFLSAIPAERPGAVEDVAKAACFLASGEANYINGQTLHVDGGMVM